MTDVPYSDTACLFADVVEKLPPPHRALYLAMAVQELDGLVKGADSIFAQSLSLGALGGISPLVPGAEVWADAVRKIRIMMITLADPRLAAVEEVVRRPVMLALGHALEQVRGCLDQFAAPRAAVMEAMRTAEAVVAPVNVLAFPPKGRKAKR